MKKHFQTLPDSELDIMLALWNGHPDMPRSEIEAQVNRNKSLAPTTILSLKNFVVSLYHGREIDREDIQELDEFLHGLEQKED